MPSPQWMKYDLQEQVFNADVGIHVGPVQFDGKVGDMLQGSVDAVKGTVGQVRTANASAQKAFDDLADWYETVSAEKIAPVQNLLAAVDDFMQDAYKAGVYIRCVRPNYGGYDHLKNEILGSFENDEDPNRPIFGEGTSMGGVVMLMSGTAAEMLLMYMLLGFLRQAPPDAGDFWLRVVDRVFAWRQVVESFEANTLGAAEDINEAAANIVNRFLGTGVGKFAKGAADQMTQTTNPVERFALKYGESKDLIDYIRKPEEKYVLRFDLMQQGGLEWDKDVSPNSGRVRAVGAGEAIVHALNPMTGKVLTQFIIECQTNMDPIHAAKDQLSNFFGPNSNAEEAVLQLFDRWDLVFTPLKAIPGATRFVSNAHEFIESTNAEISATDGFIKDAIAEVGDTVSSVLNHVETVGSEVTGALESAIYDLTNLLKVALLWMPFTAGGSHQFQYALEQYLSNDAPEAPFMQEGDFVGAVILTWAIPFDVNSPQATPIYQAVDQVLKLFGINLPAAKQQ